MITQLSADAIRLDDEMTEWIEHGVDLCPILCAVLLGWDAERINRVYEELLSYYTED